jgi:putative tricarboxylic transport membrane protein
MKKKDLVSSIVFLVLAGILFLYSGTYPQKASGSVVLNPGFYPQMLSIILAMLSIILFVSSLKKGKDHDQKKEEDGIWATKKSIILFVLTLGTLLLFPLIMNFLGFATSVFFFLFVVITALTNNAKSKILPILAVAIGLTALMYFVFKVFLRIPFPTGILI